MWNVHLEPLLDLTFHCGGASFIFETNWLNPLIIRKKSYFHHFCLTVLDYSLPLLDLIMEQKKDSACLKKAGRKVSASVGGWSNLHRTYNKARLSVGISLWNHRRGHGCQVYTLWQWHTMHQQSDSHQSDLRHPGKYCNPLEWNKKMATLEHEPESRREKKKEEQEKRCGI